MSFALPQERAETAAHLRSVEKQAPQALRATIVQAAQELEAWKRLGESIAAQLEEIADVRVSAMASASRVDEIQRQFKGQLFECARRLREMP